MLNKNFAAIITLTAVFIGMAAFIVGMLLTRRVEPGISFRDLSSILIPAPELPGTAPQVTGPFIERQDNTLILESKSLGADGLGASSPTRTRNQRDPQVEVLVTDVMIYSHTAQIKRALFENCEICP
jgi:hypothetical protein